jgi:hypothetical protein
MQSKKEDDNNLKLAIANVRTVKIMHFTFDKVFKTRSAEISNTTKIKMFFFAKIIVLVIFLIFFY